MAGPADFYSYDGESKFTRSGLNWELRLLTSGTLKFRTAVSADLFAVGGGGAGGLYGGGGSGYTNTVRAQSLPSTSLSVTIGDGGAAVAASGSATSLVNGETTVITANGGNGGSSNSTAAPAEMADQAADQAPTDRERSAAMALSMVALPITARPTRPQKAAIQAATRQR